MPPLLTAAALAAASLALAGTAGAQEIKGNAGAGKEKVAVCRGCHGIEDYRTAYPHVYRVPKLGGQQAAYIARALKAYQSGERWHPSMRGIARSLSDQDIADVAAYYSGAAK